MSKKYKEIMDQVWVTDEMKQRVLQNVKAEMEAEVIAGMKSGRFRSRSLEKRQSQEKSCIAVF